MPTPSGSPSNQVRIDLINHIGRELGRTSPTPGANQTSLNDPAVRRLAGKEGDRSTIKMSDLWGKTAEILSAISGNLVNHTINVSTLPGYVAGKASIRIRINSGIYVYSTSTSIPGLTITGAVAGDTITLENNGFIMGKGGHGGDMIGGKYYETLPGLPGGPALRLSYTGATMIINTTNGYIGGGGGGGGCSSNRQFGGGGAGGGEGGGRVWDWGYSVSGGLPGNNGGTGWAGTAPWYGSDFHSCGGGGGRILPGTGGVGRTIRYLGQGGGYSIFDPDYISLAGPGGGAGGAGGVGQNGRITVTGGSGGSGGNPGTTGTYSAGGGGGGGWGAAGAAGGGPVQRYLAREGGAGGKAIDLVGNSVTFTGTSSGRIFGAIS